MVFDARELTGHDGLVVRQDPTGPQLWLEGARVEAEGTLGQWALLVDPVRDRPDRGVMDRLAHALSRKALERDVAGGGARQMHVFLSGMCEGLRAFEPSGDRATSRVEGG